MIKFRFLSVLCVLVGDKRSRKGAKITKYYDQILII